MKRKIIILLCATFLLGCSKDNRIIPKATTKDCRESLYTFSRELTGGYIWCDLLEDAAKNIVLAGDNSIEKYTPDGTLLWKKSVSLPGQVQQVIQADGDHYFVASASYEIESFGANELYNKDAGPGSTLDLVMYIDTWGKLDKECKKMYNRVQAQKSFILRNSLPQNTSMCALTKLDNEGNLLWARSFRGNYFKGTSVAASPDGNLYLLTLKQSGFYKSALFDQNGVFQDTLETPSITENSFTLYKISPEGNIVWQKDFDHMYKDQADYDGLVNLVSTGGQVFIQTGKDMIRVTHGGAIVSAGLAADNCGYETYGCVVAENLVYSTCYGQGPDRSYSGFFSKYDQSGNKLSTTSTTAVSRNTMLKVSGDGFLLCNNNGLWKVSKEFALLWGRTDLDMLLKAAIGTCSGGAISVQYKGGKYLLSKTNANGGL